MAGYLTPSPRARILTRVFLGQLLVGWIGAALLVTDGDPGGFLLQAAMWNLWVCVPTAVVASLVLLATPRTAMRWSWWQAAVVVVLGPMVPAVVWHEQGGGGVADYVMMAAATALGVFLATRRLLLRVPSGMDASPRARILGRVFLGQMLAVWLLTAPIMGIVNGVISIGDPWWSAWLFGGAVLTMLVAVPASAVAAVLLLLDRRAGGPRWGWLQVILVLLLAPLPVIGVFGDYRASGATDPGGFLAVYYPVWMAEVLPGLLITQAMLVFPRIRANAD